MPSNVVYHDKDGEKMVLIPNRSYLFTQSSCLYERFFRRWETRDQKTSDLLQNMPECHPLWGGLRQHVQNPETQVFSVDTKRCISELPKEIPYIDSYLLMSNRYLQHFYTMTVFVTCEKNLWEKTIQAVAEKGKWSWNSQ